MNVEPALPRFALSGKSRSLQELQPHLHCSVVPEFLVVGLDEWQHCRQSVLLTCQQRFPAARLAVRSDAGTEDQPGASQAGRFLSLLDISPGDLGQAIDRVMRSLPGQHDDRVMVQRMVAEIRVAGVAATHRVHDGAPWYCFELASGDSAAVTAGRANGRQIAIARESAEDPVLRSQLTPTVLQVLDVLRETEALCPGIPLEIELAIAPPVDGSTVDKAYLLQARPIVQTNWPPSPPIAAPSMPRLDFLSQPDPCPSVTGPQTVLSLMADWNPAELLGAHPRPLAVSLFRELIADGVWWQARADLGYTPIPEAGITLLHPIMGRPMVDVRRSANSLLPAGLPGPLASLLIQHQMDHLKAQPEMHDKVEFEVYRTVRDLRPHRELAHRWEPLLGRTAWRQWEEMLGHLGRRLTRCGPGSDLERHLALLRQLLQSAPAHQRWQHRLHRARQAGFSFSALARLAFVGEAQLRSGLVRGALSTEGALRLKAEARNRFAHGADSGPAESLDLLRPSSFDIRIQPSRFALPDAATSPASNHSQPPLLAAREQRAIAQLLCEAELDMPVEHWVQFVQSSASAREWGKQILSAELCAALEDLAGELGRCGLNREQASWLTLDQLRAGQHISQTEPRHRFWRSCAESAQTGHDAQARQILSPVLRSNLDRHVADSLHQLPNFVGRQRVSGHLVMEPRMDHPGHDLQKAIVVLHQADPGYDWLFGHRIAGLITAWGGANSHMAIRCAEQGIAAAIGCGEALLTRARRASRATIDPPGGALWLN